MKSARLCTIIIISVCLMLLFSACSSTKKVPESLFKEYKSDVLSCNGADKLEVTFTRPDVDISVHIQSTIDETDIDRIFELTKSYVTVENVDKIAEHVKWNREISQVRLRIIDNSNNAVIRDYWTRYFKSYDATDYSADNIDGYKTWKELE